MYELYSSIMLYIHNIYIPIYIYMYILILLLPIYGTQGISSYRNTGIRPNCMISAALKDVRPNPRGARLYTVFELK